MKTYFHGTHSLDETGIKSEQYSIEHERQKSLDAFYLEFTACDFERAFRLHHPNQRSSSIERRCLCENHISYCQHVENSIKVLFAKWDHILSLFPSHATLKEYDPRFNSETREGEMFYEKLSVFQAWFNLNGEINRLLDVLGRIIGCQPCQKWPAVSSSSTSRAQDTTSRPPTPSSTASHDFTGTLTASPSATEDYLLNQPMLKQQYSSLSATSRTSTSSSVFTPGPDVSSRRHPPISAMSSVDNTQANLGPTSSLPEYYYR